ncbi:MAG: hypothetical protein AAF215_08105 [Cyanobacteria bacterium P01_A01_bin.123]
MSRFTTASLKLFALMLGLGLLSVSAVAQAQSTDDPLRNTDDATVGGSSENLLNSPFDLFHEAALSGGTSREEYRQNSTEQIGEAAAEFRQQGGYGQQPLQFEYIEAPTETVESEGN